MKSAQQIRTPLIGTNTVAAATVIAIVSKRAMLERVYVYAAVNSALF